MSKSPWSKEVIVKGTPFAYWKNNTEYLTTLIKSPLDRYVSPIRLKNPKEESEVLIHSYPFTGNKKIEIEDTINKYLSRIDEYLKKSFSVDEK